MGGEKGGVVGRGRWAGLEALDQAAGQSSRPTSARAEAGGSSGLAHLPTQAGTAEELTSQHIAAGRGSAGAGRGGGSSSAPSTWACAAPFMLSVPLLLQLIITAAAGRHAEECRRLRSTAAAAAAAPGQHCRAGSVRPRLIDPASVDGQPLGA